MKRSVIALGLVAGLAGLGVTGCSGDHAAASKPKPTSTTAAFVTAAAHTPGTLKHFVGAKADVRDTTCSAGAKGWHATGTLKNPTRAPARYRVFVSFLDGDTTTGVAEADVAKLGPGKSGTWSAAVGTDGTNLRCILPRGACRDLTTPADLPQVLRMRPSPVFLTSRRRAAPRPGTATTGAGDCCRSTKNFR